MSGPAPIFSLKRRARLLSRSEGIPLHAALDQVAASEGFRRWSLLAARREGHDNATSTADIHARLLPGDMVLIGARPGHGKTLMALKLAAEAMQAGHRAAFFSLEYAERHMLDRFRAIGVDPVPLGQRFLFDTSEDISSGHVVGRLAGAQAGTFAVIDYLQILDQQRKKPDLATQLRELRAFARSSGVTLAIISQIDRSYDPTVKALPDLADVRRPNPVDLSLFDKAIFLNDGRVGLSDLPAAA